MKKIKNFNQYSVTKTGEVYGPKGKLKLLDCGMGYKKVMLYGKYGPKNKRVHRLIAETFLGAKQYHQVNHIDGNKHNNKVENLELCSPKQNIAHAAKLGKHNSKSKLLLTKADFELVCQLLDKDISTKTIAEIINRSQRCVQYIKKNRYRTNFSTKNKDIA